MHKRNARIIDATVYNLLKLLTEKQKLIFSGLKIMLSNKYGMHAFVSKLQPYKSMQNTHKTALIYLETYIYAGNSNISV